MPEFPKTRWFNSSFELSDRYWNYGPSFNKAGLLEGAMELPPNFFSRQSKFVITPVRDLLNAQRESRGGNYDVAEKILERSLTNGPHNTRLRQALALVRFSLGNYARAAEETYDTLAEVPALDWPTVLSFYTDVGEYTKHFRSLEWTARVNDSADVQFLLASHYLMLGHHKAAAVQLDKVAAKLPGDAVIRRIQNQLAKHVTPPSIAEHE